MHDRILVLFLLVVGQPLAVRRPGVICDLGVPGMIDLDGLLLRDVHIPKVKVFISPCDFLAVRRPCRWKLESLVAAGDLLFLAEAILGRDVDFVLPSPVRNVADPSTMKPSVRGFPAYE